MTIVSNEATEEIESVKFDFDNEDSLSGANLLLMAVQEFLMDADAVGKMMTRVNAKIDMAVSNVEEDTPLH
jgi:hypothetical protein